jgi:flagellin
MSLTVNTNIPSLTAQRNLGLNNDMLAKSLERLSSGLRVNRSADDAAGLSIATKLSMQSRGLRVAVRNAGDAGSLVNTAEGAFNVATNIIGRLRELAVQAASDTNTAADRATLGGESSLLVAELNRLASTTEFNGASLLDGSFSSGKVQVGANADQTITFSLGDVRAAQLGKFAAFSVNVADGVSGGVFRSGGAGAITTGEFNVNGQLVGATTTTDDQISVLSLTATTTDAAADASVLMSALSGGQSAAIYINGTKVVLTSDQVLTNTTDHSASNFNSLLVGAINAAGITNVTARLASNYATFTLDVAKGTDLKVTLSAVAAGNKASGLASMFTLSTAGSFVGSTVAYTSSDDISIYNGQSSAIAKAAAINSIKSKSGVTAVAVANIVSMATAVTAGTLATNQLFINGFAIEAATITASDGTGTLRAAINAKTSSTGVTAGLNSSGALILSAADGRNISIYQEAAAETITDLLGTPASGATVYRGAIRMTSQSDVSFSGTTTDIGSASTTVPYTADLANSVALMDITTQSGANTAIMTLDAALTQISKVRSDVGALTSRLELTTQALTVSAENQEAAAARIKDADFAYETAHFTRNQILVQAGTAILAQANKTSEIALQLLR